MVEKLVTPFLKFAKVEKSSGVLLFIATIIALLWANSPFQESYHHIWQYKIGIISEHFSLYKPLVLWINDGLMTIFFFLIGLELKRELLIGELDTTRKASFPILAAIGGMIMPVCLFIVLNKNPETINGWGIPMAADIAFILAILNVLGKRVPVSLKVFLTAFAIIDDIGAVVVIAIFYSSGIKWGLLAIAGILLLFLTWLSYKKIDSKYIFGTLAVIIWLLFLKSGIHPTVSGVLLAFTVSIRQRIDVRAYTSKLLEIATELKNEETQSDIVLNKTQVSQVYGIEVITDSVQSPLQQKEHRLHYIVAYFIVPLFALANAGVSINSEMNIEIPLVINTVLCLIVGNFVGVTVFSFISLKLKITQLPQNTVFSHILGVACLAGVGFTMSIFIANLAFSVNPAFVDSAKIGILIGSFLSGVLGFIWLRIKGGNNNAQRKNKFKPNVELT